MKPGVPIGSVSLAAAICLIAGLSHAAIIDFENAADNTALGTIAGSDGNSVTFSLPGGGSAFVATYGKPMTAFVTRDTPKAGYAGGGARFLTDEPTTDAWLSGVGDYFGVFAKGVSRMSIATLDYRNDGGGRVDDQVILEAFGNENFASSLGTAFFTIVAGLPDGAVQTLAFDGLGQVIRSFKITHSRRDVGTGLDNLEYTTATTPIPAALPLFAGALAGLGLLGFRKRKPA